MTAIKNVVGYQKILDRYSGKRLPPQVDIVANLIEREFQLAAEAARICAGVFLSSVQRAGLVQADNTLVTNPTQHLRTTPAIETSNAKTVPQNSPAAQFVPSDDSESHYLTLDAKRGRRDLACARRRRRAGHRVRLSGRLRRRIKQRAARARHRHDRLDLQRTLVD